MITAGVDEAGRGALAGPVVAAAVCMSDDLKSKKHHAWTQRIKDSKVMTDKDRRECYVWITKHCDWSTGIIYPQEIDLMGIRPATEKAMNQAVKKIMNQIKEPIEKLQIDGRDRFSFPIESEDIVGGDGKILEISAASIIAKVLRDDIMIDLDHQYPLFGFAHNKGYGAADHMDLVSAGEYCLEHRKTYDPLKTWLHQGKFTF